MSAPSYIDFIAQYIYQALRNIAEKTMSRNFQCYVKKGKKSVLDVK